MRFLCVALLVLTLVACQSYSVESEGRVMQVGNKATLCRLASKDKKWIYTEQVPEALVKYQNPNLTDRQFLWYKNGKSRLMMCEVAKNPSSCGSEESMEFVFKRGSWEPKDGSVNILLCTAD